MKSKIYTAPALRVHGKLEALTQGFTGTFALDAAFPANTPFSQLTFS